MLSTESPFDRWRKGDEKAVSASAKNGFELFQDKAKCAVCHMGYNFTDNGFHNIGLKTEGAPDVGRFAQRPLKSMHGAFKTPTLRDIGRTAPYMRNGCTSRSWKSSSTTTVVAMTRPNLDINMVPLSLTASEKADLVAFLESLTGVPPDIRVPALPL